jgi:hypothetical protein
MKNNTNTQTTTNNKNTQKKKSSWLTTNYAISGYSILIRTLVVILVTLMVGTCIGVGITHTDYKVKDTEGRGYVYTVEGTVVAIDDTLCTIEDTEGTLWLVDSDTLTRDSTVLMYVVDNNTNTQRDDEIARLWIAQ